MDDRRNRMWTIGGTGCTYAGSVAAEALQLTSDGGHVVVEDLQSASELGVTAGPLGPPTDPLRA